MIERFPCVVLMLISPLSVSVFEFVLSATALDIMFTLVMSNVFVVLAVTAPLEEVSITLEPGAPVRTN